MKKLKAILTTIIRILNVLLPPEHSVYTRCWDCHYWGINLPYEEKCANCGSVNTSEYYPTRNYKSESYDQTGSDE